MARSHGRVKVEVWSDPQWRSLTTRAQRAYILLISQAQINNCGILAYTPRKWARLAADETQDNLLAALSELHGHRFIIVDDDHEELLVRTFVHHDRIEEQPNLVKAAQREYLMIESPRLRQILADQYPELFTEGAPEGVPPLTYEGVPEGVPEPLSRARDAHTRPPPAPSPTPPPLERAGSSPTEESVRLSLSREEQDGQTEPYADAPLALASDRSAPAHNQEANGHMPKDTYQHLEALIRNAAWDYTDDALNREIDDTQKKRGETLTQDQRRQLLELAASLRTT